MREKEDSVRNRGEIRFTPKRLSVTAESEPRCRIVEPPLSRRRGETLNVEKGGWGYLRWRAGVLYADQSSPNQQISNIWWSQIGARGSAHTTICGSLAATTTMKPAVAQQNEIAGPYSLIRNKKFELRHPICSGNVLFKAGKLLGNQRGIFHANVLSTR